MADCIYYPHGGGGVEDTEKSRGGGKKGLGKSRGRGEKDRRNQGDGVIIKRCAKNKCNLTLY